MIEAQRRFLATIDEDHSYDTLFDYLDGVSFFVKNKNFEIMKANKCLLSHLGMKNESDIIGKNDFQLFTESLAKKYRADDTEVVESGKPKLKILEYFTNEQGTLDWFMTNKLPLYSRSKEVIGIMGIIQFYNQAEQLIQASSYIAKAVEYIQEEYAKKISIEELAELCNISQRQLHRHFNQELGMSPQNFLIRTRIQKACKSMKADPHSPISSIAVDCGFYDQTNFTKHFKKCLGITPYQFQKKYRL